jgi:hypothetical protein
MPLELSIVKFTADTLFKVFGLETQKKQDVAKYLAEIADTLLKFGPAFRKDDHDEMVTLAAQTQSLAQKFVVVTAGVLSPEDVKNFVPRLTAAANGKMILAAGSEQNQQQKLDEIAELAGMFRGVSISLRATANRLG